MLPHLTETNKNCDCEKNKVFRKRAINTPYTYTCNNLLDTWKVNDLHSVITTKHCVKHRLKDARSVSLYPYNRSQILQYVKYTK